MYLLSYVCMYVCMYVCIYVYVCVCIPRFASEKALVAPLVKKSDKNNFISGMSRSVLPFADSRH